MNKASLSQRLWRNLAAGLATTGSLLSQCCFSQPATAATNAYCQLTQEAIAAKENLLQASLQSNGEAKTSYQTLLKQHAEILRQCRARTWPQTQAIWLRLHPCDIRPGSLDYILDRIVNLGYNTVYLEVFFDSQVLLPPADNPTPWLPVVRTPGAEKVDLMAQAIQKGRERGLKMYAWLFTMNFGYSYAQLPEHQAVLARNGKGEDSLAFVHDQSQAFIDPYNPEAQQDYAQLIEAVLKRRPDGVLFDYVRYPRGTGSQSAVGQVKELWIYGPASLQALSNRAQNQKGRFLIERFLTQGNISAGDVATADRMYPDEGPPRWQGRHVAANEMQATAGARLPRLQQELWHLTVAHAAQGVIDFLTLAASRVQRQGIPTGAVFFPDGNQLVGEKGFDSRLQAWDKFPTWMEWHPMSYAVCSDANCVVQQVQRVVSVAGNSAPVIPALAGLWGQIYKDRPPLEVQMQAIRQAIPQIKAISHFAFSWQEPELERERRFCKL